MIWKILAVLLGIWLFFKWFGKRIFLYLLSKLVQRLEQQTLRDMRYFEKMYDEHARQAYHLNDDFSVIIPEKKSPINRNIGKKEIQDIDFEEIPNK